MEENKQNDPQLEFDKFKYKMDLFKWIIGSVALVLATAIIDWGFRDRAAGLQEIQQYDKYVTELIILNKEVGPRRLLAQYYSIVTASDRLRERWEAYYQVLDKEYQQYLVQDSMVNEQIGILKNKNDTSQAAQMQLMELERLSDKINQELNAGITTPTGIVGKNYSLASDWEKKGFDYLLNRDVNNAILAFGEAEKAYPKFHQVYEINSFLSKNREKLKDPNSPFWANAGRTIAQQYSWKMPNEIKVQLEKQK